MLGIVWYNWGFWAALAAFFACGFCNHYGRLQGIQEAYNQSNR